MIFRKEAVLDPVSDFPDDEVVNSKKTVKIYVRYKNHKESYFSAVPTQQANEKMVTLSSSGSGEYCAPWSWLIYITDDPYTYKVCPESNETDSRKFV